ncbi:ECF transporter S component [Ornithinibacillus sp. BX22]|uniref:ECF transporter S component n=3 Tax=Bacillaceae TaxID=186817 RepID=A0A923L5F2_9BACI|nr:ECF transporter S component [Ornithinibacillus hominis]MBS3681328.1 ECF transporter S component [Ornithinibacillus massiliensis]
MIFSRQHYLIFSLIIIVIVLFFFFNRFEMRQVRTREIVILAMLSAIAAISRVPFAGLPSVQPTSFVIITAGLVFGAESGFLVGAVAAIVSNLFLGQGPWTPWQMFSWGIMGFSAGVLRDLGWMGKVWIQSIFGFLWGFLFGWLMNLWIVINNLQNFSLEFIMGIYISSFSHDLAHAISNTLLIAILSTRWVKVLFRFKRKYGLLEKGTGNSS